MPWAVARRAERIGAEHSTCQVEICFEKAIDWLVRLVKNAPKQSVGKKDPVKRTLSPPGSKANRRSRSFACAGGGQGSGLAGRELQRRTTTTLSPRFQLSRIGARFAGQENRTHTVAKPLDAVQPSVIAARRCAVTRAFVAISALLGRRADRRRVVPGSCTGRSQNASRSLQGRVAIERLQPRRGGERGQHHHDDER